MVSTISVIFILTVSGCITINMNGPTPTPTATPTSTTTPTPTATFPAADNIVGLWEGSKNSVNYSIQFFNDGKLIYDEGGNLANGGWQKKDGKQYLIGITISDTMITLNDNMTFYWGVKGIFFTKKL